MRGQGGKVECHLLGSDTGSKTIRTDYCTVVNRCVLPSEPTNIYAHSEHLIFTVLIHKHIFYMNNKCSVFASFIYNFKIEHN